MDPEARIRNPESRIREANLLRIRPDPDPDPNRTFVWPLKKYVVKNNS
jgi:hypothetical protein